MSSLFTKIISGELPCEKVHETENVFAFKDIAPKAPVHILIVPKKEIKDLQSVKPEDAYIIAEMIQVAQHIAKEYDIVDGYRLLTNNGPGSGQAVFHLHFHLLGGGGLSDDLA